MKNFIIIGLVIFVAWVFLGKKAENLKQEALGNNTSPNPANGNVGSNPNGGANVESQIVDAASGTINHLIDRAFNYAQSSNPPQTTAATL